MIWLLRETVEARNQWNGIFGVLKVKNFQTSILNPGIYLLRMTKVKKMYHQQTVEKEI